MNAQALIKKINAVLKKVNATDRLAYKRLVVVTGGDSFLGVQGMIHKTDTLLNPQPAIEILGPGSEMLVSGGSVLEIGTVVMTVTPTMLSKAELQAKNLFIVFKDGAAEEEYDVESYVPSILGGTDVVYTLILKSKGRA